MDCQMTGMDGLEATRRIRQDPQWDAFPVIAMTASLEPDDLRDAITAGMNDTVAKPIDADQLLETLIGCVTHAPDAQTIAPDVALTTDPSPA